MEPNTRRRGVIKRERVRVDGPTPAAPARSESAEHAEHTPRVRLMQLDEHTQALEFTCPCGEVSLIEIQSENVS
jgi:hypothetical protein